MPCHINRTKCMRKHLEVLVKGKVSTYNSSRCRLVLLLVLLCARHDTGLLVITDTLLEEVGLACQRDVLHKVEWVSSIVVLLNAKSEEKTVGDELDVLAHELGVHTEKSARKSV